MYATVISLLIVLFFAMQGRDLLGEQLPVIRLAFALLFPFLGSLVFVGSFTALQAGEQTGTPKSLELLKADPKLRASLIFLFLWPILSFVQTPAYNWAFLFILIGLGLDASRFLLIRLLDHLNPFRLVKLLEEASLRFLQQDQQTPLCETIEALGEMGAKGIVRGNSTLANQTVKALETIGRRILAAEKNSGKDTLTYMILFILQQMEILFKTAIERGGGLSLGNLTTAVTKLAAHAATVDLSLTLYPLHYLRRMAKKAVEEGHLDVGVKTTLSSMALAKEISALPSLESQELEAPYRCLIDIMEEIAKESFRKDKNTPIVLLMQPFLDLKTLFNDKKLVNHQDTPAIQKQLDRIIGEFQALDALLKTMPPLPNLSEVKEPEISNPPE
jgi:hypothetical protein